MMPRISLAQRLQPNPQLTPPPSPGKRRRYMRESEETDGEMTLEQYLYRSDAYRASSFENPLPFPLKFEEPAPNFRLNGRDIRPLMPEILSILDRNSIKKENTCMSMRKVSKPGYPGGETPLLALVLQINHSLQIRASWPQARDELRRVFCARGLSEVQVEIYDRELVFQPSLLLMKPNHRAIRSYEEKRSRLLEFTETVLGAQWVAMSVFGFSSGTSKAQPALVIFVKPWTFLSWAEVGTALRNIWPDPNVLIEFLPGCVDEMAGRAIGHRLTQYPEMGASIGQKDKAGEGTLGGFVIHKKGSISRFGSLTNHRVVKPHDDAPLIVRDKIDQFGYGSNNPGVVTHIQYPAPADLKASKEDVDDILVNWENEIAEVEASLEKFTMKGVAQPERQINRLERAKNSMKLDQGHRAYMETLPLQVGKVLCSSGEAISTQKSIIDWAFIESPIPCTFSQRNKLPSADSPGLMQRLSNAYKLSEAPYRCSGDPPEYADTFGTIEKGKWYFKIGRTSYITTGVCHGIELDVRRTGQVRWDENGQKIILGLSTTREMLIVGKANIGAFSEPGDSGSFVINGRREIAGLLYGQFHCYTVDIVGGLVTSMDEVLASVEAKSGGRLSLP
jgi:hypothetical protein